MPRRKIIPYHPKLKELSRQLRNSSTLSEVLLWQQIKGRRMRGYQFLRQRPIDKYIVDFFCYELTLALEIDGDSHNEKVEQDQYRQKRLESLGVSFLRFTDRDVKKNLNGVLQRIEGWIDEFERNRGGRTPPLAPLKGGILRTASRACLRRRSCVA